MKKFFMLFWLVALLFLASYFSSVSASPPGPYEPAIEEHKKAKAAAEKKAKESNTGKAKPAEVRDTVPKAGSEQKALTGPKQMYKWKDERGQWRFSDNPPTGVKAQLVGGSDKREAMKLAGSLGRSYAGIRLGENLESISATKRATERAKDALGLRVFSLGKGQGTPGAEDLTVGFLQDNLVSIKVKYFSRYIQTVGGWDGYLQEATATYGNPAKVDNKRALWKDNETGLLLVRSGDGGVIATFGEIKSAFTPQDLE